jgi:hypothetical protein
MVQFLFDRRGFERQTDVRLPRRGLRRASAEGGEKESARGGPGPFDGSTAGREPYLLERVLELLERRRLSAGEVRVLLALRAREKTIVDIAEELDCGPVRPSAVCAGGAAQQVTAPAHSAWGLGAGRMHASTHCCGLVTSRTVR